VFPDLSANGETYNEWKKKVVKFANKLPKTNVLVNDFLEQYAPNELRQAGGDFADFLCQFTWQEYQSGSKSVKSVENDTQKKHLLDVVPVDITEKELQQLLQPQTGYSMKEIVYLLTRFGFFHKLNDLETMDYLLCKEVIKQDCERDNYYRFDSTPF
jgi:hypothetical protein